MESLFTANQGFNKQAIFRKDFILMCRFTMCTICERIRVEWGGGGRVVKGEAEEKEKG